MQLITAVITITLLYLFYIGMNANNKLNLCTLNGALKKHKYQSVDSQSSNMTNAANWLLLLSVIMIFFCLSNVRTIPVQYKPLFSPKTF